MTAVLNFIHVGTVLRVRVLASQVAGRTADVARAAPRRAPVVVVGLLRDATRSRAELVLENAFSRQQLIVAARTTKRPRFATYERALLVLLARFVPRWRDAVLLVQRETVLRWHREGFSLLWRWKSRPKNLWPTLPGETITLIRRMADENGLWGEERICGELLKLGIRVAKRTAQRHMRMPRPHPRPGVAQGRPTLESPSSRAALGWRSKMRNATPFGEGPRFIIRDRDDKLGRDFDRAAQGVGESPQNADSRTTRERRMRALPRQRRRECLDHVVVLGEQHLLQTLVEYCRYLRSHQGIGQLVPVASASAVGGQRAFVARAVLNRLHHDYRRAP